LPFASSEAVIARACPVRLLSAGIVVLDAPLLPGRKVGVIGEVILLVLRRTLRSVSMLGGFRGFIEDPDSIEDLCHLLQGGTTTLHRGGGKLLDAADEGGVTGATGVHR
jgi:hypothetical protein